MPYLRTSVLVSLAISACHAPPVELTRQDPAPVAIHTPARSVEGRALEITVLGDGEESVLLLATIHGDEWAGTPLLERLVRHLLAHPELAGDRRVVVLPCANPDGYAAGRRTNARGVDLNRNFPASNRRTAARHGAHALSEPEAQFVRALVERERPTRIVSIHQPLGCIDWDGPGEALAERMGTHGALPIRRLGARPGSLGSWAGEELGIPVITLELPGGAQRLSEDELWERYGALLLTAIE